MSFRSRLREERHRLGMTQAEFAARGGVGQWTQLQFEDGTHLPHPGYLRGIAAAGADVTFIVTGQRSAAHEVAQTQVDPALQLSTGQRVLLQTLLTNHLIDTVAAAGAAYRCLRAPLLERAREIEELLRLVSSTTPSPSGDQAAARTEPTSHAS